MYLLQQLPLSYINNIYHNVPSYFYKIYYLNNLFSYAFFKATIATNTVVVNIFHEYLYVIFFIFKKHTSFRYQQLSDIACVDSLTSNKRFSLYYYLLSFLNADRIVLSLDLNELATPYSLTPLYKGAN
jgi:NADH:ubiquinone oxidoreductase subunit C